MYSIIRVKFTTRLIMVRYIPLEINGDTFGDTVRSQPAVKLSNYPKEAPSRHGRGWSQIRDRYHTFLVNANIGFRFIINTW